MSEEKERQYTLTITMKEEVLTEDTEYAPVLQDEFLVMNGFFCVPGDNLDRFWLRSRILTYRLKHPLMENTRWWLMTLQAKRIIDNWTVDMVEVTEDE